MSTRYQQKPNLTEQQVGGERMIFDEHGDRVHVLNDTAAFIWDCMKEPAAPDVIETRLRANYSVPATTDVAASIRRTITELLKKGLVAALEVSPS